MNDNKLMNRAADNIRILAAAMVEKAKSGHPGGAMGGADFIKTSTGKIAVNATPEAAQVMLEVIKKHFEHTGKWVGFKAAGGISTPDEVLKYVQLAEYIIGEKQITNQFFRIGASRLTERLFDFLTQ